ncbi:MAG TPA: SDR family oxidoreductase, partial [Gammaproteobacteria bacterium]|nr:SDR family oxidoreductase [Gammaproteobacteria bacterium]
TALVTGASDGLGAYIARALAVEGARVVLAARSADKLESVARSIRERGGEAISVQADVTDETARANLVKRARIEFERIDILVNNAGVEDIVCYEWQRPEDIRRLIEVNLLAPLLLARQILPDMLERGDGHIVNLASLAGRTGMPYGAVYAATKSGLTKWSLSLRTELADRGVRVSVISPGFVADAGMFARRETSPPAGLGVSRPTQVARAVIKALETNAAEIIVNPRPARLLTGLEALSPQLATRVAERFGLVSFLRGIARKS